MSSVTSAKPYGIAKRTVWEAYQQVKANRGAAGVDGQHRAGDALGLIAQEERDRIGNILDVDQAPGQVMFSHTNYLVGEGDGAAGVYVPAASVVPSTSVGCTRTPLLAIVA